MDEGRFPVTACKAEHFTFAVAESLVFNIPHISALEGVWRSLP